MNVMTQITSIVNKRSRSTNYQAGNTNAQTVVQQANAKGIDDSFNNAAGGGASLIS